jgi:hypothetical protein
MTMAQTNATVLVQGNVVKHERKRGSMPARENPNETITWDYIEARVLTPAFDTVDVRFPADGAVPVPEPDELVLLRCEARISGGNLKLTAQAVLDPSTLVGV